MKANAPKKLYLEAIYPDNGVLPNGLNYTPSPTDIEYTRTDAFIEKACGWIKKSITNNPECNRIISKKEIITMGALIEDFRKYMEGE